MLEELLDKYNSRHRLRDYLSGFVHALNLERRTRRLTPDEERVIAFYMAMCVADTAPIYRLVRLADQLIKE